jgi:predicted RNase H-like nuclease (RuvC/YqgF family)
LTVEDLKAIEPGEPREITALEHHVEQLAEESRALRVANEDQQAHIENLNQALRDVQSSLSWRVTSPLRRTKSRFGR